MCDCNNTTHNKFPPHTEQITLPIGGFQFDSYKFLSFVAKVPTCFRLYYSSKTRFRTPLHPRQIKWINRAPWIQRTQTGISNFTRGIPTEEDAKGCRLTNLTLRRFQALHLPNFNINTVNNWTTKRPVLGEMAIYGRESKRLRAKSIGRQRPKGARNGTVREWSEKMGKWCAWRAPVGR